MKETPVIDARSGDHIVAQGSQLRKVISATIQKYRDANLALLNRMDNELADKKTAITVMIAIASDDPSLNEGALFFKACVTKAVWYEREIRDLNTLAQSFNSDALYRLTLADATRMGL